MKIDVDARQATGLPRNCVSPILENIHGQGSEKNQPRDQKAEKGQGGRNGQDNRHTGIRAAEPAEVNPLK
jgi:hypothetical protein